MIVAPVKLSRGGVAALLAAALMVFAAPGPARAQDRLEELDPRRVDVSFDEPARDGSTDWPMYLDPRLPRYQTVAVFPARLRTLWLEALDQPEVEMRRLALNAIGTAHEAGMPGWAEATPRIVRMLEAPEPLVRLAAARALIRIEARTSADALLARNRQDGSEMALLTDPALATWRHAAAYPLWTTRAGDESAQRAFRLSALDALRRAGDASAAAPMLRSLVEDRRAAPELRLAAAEALAVIEPNGLEPLAGALQFGSMVDRIAAARLLKHHEGDAAQTLLLAMVGDAEPAVAAAAIERLLALDPLALAPVADELLSHDDPKVRHLAAQAVAAQRSARAIAALARLLNDDSPEIRFFVRRHYIEADAEAGLSDAVRDAAVRQLESQNWHDFSAEALPALIEREWRRLEQAVMIVGAIDHQPAAPRLVALLAYPRVEVRVAAAVGLRRLAVAEVLPAMLAYAEETARLQLAGPFPNPQENLDNAADLDGQMAQLMQALGLMRFQPAEDLLRRHIPKASGFGAEARGAAIWALGYLYEDRLDAQLARQLMDRLTDESPMDPERLQVRQMSAVTLGRMGATEQLSTLEGYARDTSRWEVGGASRWAVARITGESVPPPEPVEQLQGYWFLRPTQDDAAHDNLRAVD